jgi:hypothetical protein
VLSRPAAGRHAPWDSHLETILAPWGVHPSLALFGTNIVATVGFYDVFPAKYDPQGNPVWVQNTTSGAINGASVANQWTTRMTANAPSAPVLFLEDSVPARNAGSSG